MLIPLTKGFSALISPEDADIVGQYSWHAAELGFSRQAYAVTTVKRRTVYMHRLIIGARKGRLVDHKNTNTLDNRRHNLRFVSFANNIRNGAFARDAADLRSIYARGSRFYVRFNRYGQPNINIGTYASVEEARSARNAAALALWGDEAPLYALPHSAAA